MKRYLPLLLTLMVPAPLAAQQDSVLRDAVRLATEGRGDSARAIVRRKLATTSPADSSYAEVLYTAGVVASNSDSALRYLRRTTIEFSQSPWADRALLRIAQMAFAAGDPATTFSSAERVITDYPFSPVRAQAAYWAGRAQIDAMKLKVPGAWADAPPPQIPGLTLSDPKAATGRRSDREAAPCGPPPLSRFRSGRPS